MKYFVKASLFFIILLVPANLFAQTVPVKLEATDIPHQTFPCISSDSIVLNNPLDLSIYCSMRANNCIDHTYKVAIGGTIATLGGAVLLVTGDGNSFTTFGGFIIGVGCALNTVAFFDAINHLRWEYKRKQVDLYLKPTGATLIF